MKLSVENSIVLPRVQSPFHSVQIVFARFPVCANDLYAWASPTDRGFRFTWPDPGSTQKKVGHVRTAPPACATHDEDFGIRLAHRLLVERECSTVEPLWTRPSIILEVKANPFELIELLRPVFPHFNNVRDPQGAKPFNVAEPGSLASEGQPLSHEENDHSGLPSFETALAALSREAHGRLEN
jgi:hypothetical protein